MEYSNNNFKHTELTKLIIEEFYSVYNVLGYGFLEKVYENAMFIKLKKRGFDVERQKRIDVYFENERIGEYYADLLVNNCVIVELKATETLQHDHELQLLNYLKACRIEVGLLLNFGKRPQVKRKVFSMKRATISHK